MKKQKLCVGDTVRLTDKNHDGRTNYKITDVSPKWNVVIEDRHGKTLVVGKRAVKVVVQERRGRRKLSLFEKFTRYISRSVISIMTPQ